MQVSSEFHGARYIISVLTRANETLQVDVELEEDASKWRGEFTAKCARLVSLLDTKFAFSSLMG
jgi:hypothetical protein